MLFAIKKLRRSDLTFFEYHFQRQNVGNQKALNLSRNVFVDVLFPAAPAVAARISAGGTPAQFLLPVTIYGPGGRSIPQVVSRKILPKTAAQKNWRLNGETVDDPDDEQGRYHDLQPDDVAVLAFEGDAVPTAVWIVLLSQAEPTDMALRSEVLAAINNRSMKPISRDVLAEIVRSTAPPNHPIRELLDTDLDEALEEASVGSAAAVRRLRSAPSPRRMTAEALQDARRKAEALGRAGEELLNAWLEQEVTAGRLKSVVWMSEKNAINPWDFEIEEMDGTTVRVEVKSTSASFDRPLHISQGEIEAAAALGAIRTDLYRLFDLADSSAKLKISKDIRPFAQTVTDAVSSLGEGIIPDSYTISPERFGMWSDPALIEVPDEEDENEE
ncbi:DUF3883 domain-containing protein [Microvirga yunnanensis]|uniref:DUF3883 domain-containing protein n=1 Tax=Microvirga yunnanensis TaxID=2953740 RepID=UPI0021CA6790|nr:DUF3883 domain-containing protein [Microvirga sp. HBU65207]